MKAICTDDTTEEYKNYKAIPTKEKLKGLTKSKEYEVKQSKEYEGYFEVMNDLNKIETYKKYRFKIVGVEDMEKGFKVRCINNGGFELRLEKDGIYNVSKEINERYVLREIGEGYEFNKDRFEKVTDDVLMVECIDNQEGLLKATIGESYKVVDSDSRQYKIVDNNTNEVWCNKTRFKPVEPQKEEKKEYSLMELFEEEEGIKFKSEENAIYYVRNEGLMVSTEIGEMEVRLNRKFFKMKFTKIEEPKPVTTSEAMKSLEEGKTIESVYTRNKYKKDYKQISLIVEGFGFEECENISSQEIMDKWIIL